MLKRNWQLKEIHDTFLGQLEKGGEHGPLLVKMIRDVLALELKLSDREKGDFIDSMKGLYFLTVETRKKGIFEDYLLTSFHLEILSNKNMFKDYEEL
jgi:hypothetical protein